MSQKNRVSRKTFLTYGAMVSAVGAVGAIGIPAIFTSCSDSKKTTPAFTPLRAPDEYYIPKLTDKAIEGRPLKVGLVGCGGRGTGAVQDIMAAADGVTITAVGDVFQDRIDSVRGMLKDSYGTEISDGNCFVGFDSYQKVIDSGVDIVILTTPPSFRPEQFKYAVEKGVNSFLEKPIAVDSAGYRTIMAAGKQAQAKGLSVVTGTQRHHQRPYVESFKKIQEGMIGNVTGGSVYWNQNMLWYRNREKGWSDMEWMIRDWVNWKWLSGDHIVEQHVHNIDVFTWFSGFKPVRATAFGGRAKRVAGDQYDNFSVDFEFENGVHMHSMSRQIDGCDSNVSEFIQGSLGSWNSTNGEFVIKDLAGQVIWKHDPVNDAQHTQHNPYVLEHANLVSHIRSGEPLMQAFETAISNMAGIMGRESAYSGKSITWDEMVASSISYAPAKYEMGSVDMSRYIVPIPG